MPSTKKAVKKVTPAPKKSSSVAKKSTPPASAKTGLAAKVAKKAATKRTAAPAKASSAPAKKAPAKKAAVKATAPAVAREFDAHGFVVGSDSSTIAAILLEGGNSRTEVNDKIAKALKGKTRYGNAKNVSSLVSGLLTRLKAKGYSVEQTWRLVAPASSDAQKAAVPSQRSAPAGGAKRGAAKKAAPAKKASTGRAKRG